MSNLQWADSATFPQDMWTTINTKAIRAGAADGEIYK